MAVVTGNEYDHITIQSGSNQTVHYLKDTVARGDISDLKSALINRNPVEHLRADGLVNYLFNYSNGVYTFVANNSVLSTKDQPLYLHQGDAVSSNVQTAIGNLDDTTIRTAFANVTYIPKTGWYYLAFHKTDNSALSPSDISNITIERCPIDGFIYGLYNGMNSNSPTYAITSKLYACMRPTKVSAGQIIEFPNVRATVTIVYDDTTYKYYGAINGSIVAEHNGTLYAIIDYPGDKLNSKTKYNNGVAGTNGIVSYNTTRLAHEFDGRLVYLNDETNKFSTIYNGVDSGWLSTHYALAGENGAINESLLTNAAFTESSLLNVNINKLVYSRLVCHRGITGDAPENTLAAVLATKARGYGAIEFDVRFTSDSVPVVIHDDTINRTARNTADWSTVSTTYHIQDLTYNDLLNYYFDDDFKAKQKIPTLAEFISLCKAVGLYCVLEICHASATTYTQAEVQSVYNVVKEYGYLDCTMFTSFNGEYLKIIGDMDKTVPLGYISQSMSDAYINDTLALRPTYPMFGLAYAGNDDALSNKAINNGIPLYFNLNLTPTDLKFKGKYFIMEGAIPILKA